MIAPTEKDEEFKQIKSAFIRPLVKRIGNEIILTWDGPIDELTAMIGPFTSVTESMNCSIKGTMAFAQPLQKVISEKHSPLYSFYNGGTGELTINLDKDLMNYVSNVIPLDSLPAGRLGHIAYWLFKRANLEVETDDVLTLPSLLQSAINGEVLKSVFDFWATVAEKFKVLSSVPENLRVLGHV